MGGPFSANSPVTVSFPGTVFVTAISSGGVHSLALDNSGQVWGWGANTNGQLGQGNLTFQSTPVSIFGFSGAISISAGGAHSLVVKTGGGVWGTGSNLNGQLGDGTTTRTPEPPYR